MARKTKKLLAYKNSVSTDSLISTQRRKETESKSNSSESVIKIVHSSKSTNSILNLPKVQKASKKTRVRERPKTASLSKTRRRKFGKKANDDGKDDPIRRLQDLGIVFMRKLELCKIRQREVIAERKKIEKKIESYRIKMGGAEAVKDNSRFVSHNMHILENRLQQTKRKVMHMHAIRMKLREDIDRVRREKLFIKANVSRLKDDIEVKKKEQMGWEAKVRSVRDAIDKLKEKKQDCLDTLKDEEKRFRKEWGELGQKIDAEFDEEKEVTLVKNLGNMTQEQESQLKTETLKSIWNSAVNKISEKKALTKASSYGDAFRQICEQTGIKTLEEMVSRFTKIEDKNYSLLKEINNLKAEEEAKENLENAQLTLEKKKDEDVTRRNILDSLNKEISEVRVKYQKYRQLVKEMTGRAALLRNEIHDLFQAFYGSGNDLGLSQSFVENAPCTPDNPLGITEKNMVQFLGLIEITAHNLLTSILLEQEKNSHYSYGPSSKLKIQTDSDVGLMVLGPSSNKFPHSTRSQKSLGSTFNSPSGSNGGFFFGPQSPASHTENSIESNIQSPNIHGVPMHDSAYRHTNDRSNGSDHMQKVSIDNLDLPLSEIDSIPISEVRVAASRRLAQMIQQSAQDESERSRSMVH
eukprot:g698.t1